MGTIHHHAIIASTWKEEQADEAAEFLQNAEIQHARLRSSWNATHTFFLPPDGSKEGWPESDIGDAKRQAFIAYLEDQRYEDGVSCWDWIEVTYGELGQYIERGNCSEGEE